MASFEFKHGTSHYKDSCPAQIESVQKQVNDSHTCQSTPNNSLNYEQSWNTCLKMFGKKNSTSQTSSKKTKFIPFKEGSPILSNASQECKAQYIVGKNYVANNEDEDLVNSEKMKNASYIDMVDYDNGCRREDTQSDKLHRLDKGTYKVPVTRQCSIALDIGLDDSDKTSHEMMNEVIQNDEYETKEMHPRESQTQCDVEHFRHLQKEQIYHAGHSYHIGVHQQQLKQKPFCREKPAQAIQNGQIFENNRPLSGSHLTNTIETRQSFSQEPFYKQPTRSTSSLISSEQVNGGEKSAKKKKTLYSHDEYVNFENNGDKEVTSKFKNIISFDKLRSKTWSLTSTIRQETLTYVLIALVLVLVVVVTDLHMRVQTIEDSGRFLSKSGCQCNQDGQMFYKNQVSDVGSIKSVNEEMVTNIMKHLGKESEAASAENDDVFRESTSVSNNEDGQEFTEDYVQKNNNEENRHNRHDHSSSNDLLDSTIIRSVNSNHLKRGSLISTLNILTNWNNESGTLSKEKIAGIHFREGNTSTTLDTRIIEFKNLSLDTSSEVLSRKIRSAIKTEDENFAKTMRNGSRGNKSGGNKSGGDKSGGDKSGGNKSGGDKSGGNSKSKVESFEARFYEIFDYKRDFMDKDCFRYHQWGEGVEVCRDESVNFKTRYSVLPFYNPTNETAKKKSNHRIIVTDKKTPGQFHVQTSGEYLVQLNITVADDTEKHFLALHLNGQAMLACQHGGFRCPHTNHHTSTKYRICNIIGLLEMRKGDIMDIRTMEAGMKVRIEEVRKSYFMIVLLNKPK